MLADDRRLPRSLRTELAVRKMQTTTPAHVYFAEHLRPLRQCGSIVASIEEPTAIRAILDHFENNGALSKRIAAA
jgi:hypothetical protein